MNLFVFVLFCITVGISSGTDHRQEFKENALKHLDNCIVFYGFSPSFVEKVRNGEFEENITQAKVAIIIVIIFYFYLFRF